MSSVRDRNRAGIEAADGVGIVK
eukprot:gene1848-biopygen11141